MEKIIHQIWVGPYQLPDIEQSYINEIKQKNSEFEYILWTDANIPPLPDKLQEIYEILGTNKDYAFQADLLRIFLIYKYGGLYLDVDYKYINSFINSPFFEFDGVFFFHPTLESSWKGDFTIPNGIFGAKKESHILEYLLSTLTPEKYWMGPSWLGLEIRKYFNFSETESHETLKFKLQQQNYLYYPYNKLQQEYVFHNALASWIPEHKHQFEIGNVNFQKGNK